MRCSLLNMSPSALKPATDGRVRWGSKPASVSVRRIPHVPGPIQLLMDSATAPAAITLHACAFPSEDNAVRGAVSSGGELVSPPAEGRPFGFVGGWSVRGWSL